MIGKTFTSKNYGKFSVIAYTGLSPSRQKTYAIRFENTGYEKYGVLKSIIRRKHIKDPYALMPAYFNIGCIGEGEYSVKNNGVTDPAYRVWANMLSRCYSPNNKNFKYYGAKGVRVCSEWLIYQNFAKWYYDNRIEGCHLDKDLLSEQNKIYSPETCVFLAPKLNAIGSSKPNTYKVIHPNGKTEYVTSIKAFCKQSKIKLDPSTAYKVARGESSHHKGYKFEHYS